MQKVEGTPGVLPAFDREAMDVLSEDAALGEGGDERAPEERLVPALLGCPRGRPELERDAAEDETEQHREDREVERRQDDRERERERGEERNPAEHEPGLVPVPDRRDRGHHQIAGAIVRREREKDPDAEVEAVEQHIHEDADR